LKETKKCVTAIRVKEGDKTVTYYLQDKGNGEEYHEAVCGGEKKKGTVVGTVSMKDGKKWVKPSKVEYATKLTVLIGEWTSLPACRGATSAREPTAVAR